MNRADNSLKKPSFIAIVALLILLTGAGLLYKERLLFIDSALISFDRMNFHVEKGDMRYGVFITQMILYFGAKLHLSLKAVLIIYSISFYLFFTGVVLLLVYKYRQYSMAILMAMYYFLFVSDTWYWPHNEVHQGIAWMFLFFAIAFDMAKKKTTSYIQIPVFILLSALAVFTHPLIIISTVVLWIFFWFDGSTWYYSKKSTLFYTFLLLSVVCIKYSLSFNDAYDGWKMHNATHFSIRDVFNTFRSLYADTFWHDCLTNYWWSLLIFIMGLYAVIRGKKYLVLIWTLIFSVGYFIIVCRTFGPNAYDYHIRYYMESEWDLLSIFISAPFVFYFLPKLSSSSASLLLTAIFLTRIIYIALAFPLFHKRVAFTEQALTQMRAKGLTKVILKKDARAENLLLADWALPYESMLASNLDGDKPLLTIIELPEEKIKDAVPPESNIIMGPWSSLKDMNAFYFVPDTTRKYHVMSYDELFNK